MAISEDRFYYSQPKGTFSKQLPYVVKWGQYHLVEVDENVENCPYISFSYYKLKTDTFDKPKSSEYEKTRPIIKQVFIDHYKLALKQIHETPFEDDEFYLLNESASWYRVAYFPKEAKNGHAIEIDFRDSIDSLWLTLSGKSGHKYRSTFRKKGVAIAKERFIKFLNCTVQFLYDSDSYAIFFDDYIRNFYQLAASDHEMEEFIISAEKSFDKIISQLRLRKENIEKRLIENDSDSNIDRAKLRGELDGLLYALKAIGTHI